MAALGPYADSACQAMVRLLNLKCVRLPDDSLYVCVCVSVKVWVCVCVSMLEAFGNINFVYSICEEVAFGIASSNPTCASSCCHAKCKNDDEFLILDSCWTSGDIDFCRHCV